VLPTVATSLTSFVATSKRLQIDTSETPMTSEAIRTRESVRSPVVDSGGVARMTARFPADGFGIRPIIPHPILKRPQDGNHDKAEGNCKMGPRNQVTLAPVFLNVPRRLTEPQVLASYRAPITRSDQARHEPLGQHRSSIPRLLQIEEGDDESRWMRTRHWCRLTPHAA
jgi:hypothetical protein